MAIQEWKVDKPYLSLRCSLGEAPYHSTASHKLRFVDIVKRKLYILDLARGPESLESIDTGMPVSVTADLEGEATGDIILVGAKDGVTKFNIRTGEHIYIVKYWAGNPLAEDYTRRLRSNDGAVDRRGRFWVSACVDPEAFPVTDDGVLMRLDNNGKLNTLLSDAQIPNGISWSVSNDIMYYTDSQNQKLYAFDFDTETGNISNKTIFYCLDEVGVFPDGHALDIEGNLWVACWGGSKVIRISPAGTLIGIVRLPTRNVTACAFVGTELFITTATEAEPWDDLRSSNYGGALFKVEVGVRGMPITKAQLDV